MVSKADSPVREWTSAEIGTTSTAGDNFTFPAHALALAKPAVVRNPANGKSVVAAGFRAPLGKQRGILTSATILGKLGCNHGDTIDYKTASFIQVIWSKKRPLVLALLGFIIAAGSVVAGTPGLYPQSHTVVVFARWTAGAVVVVALLAAAISAVSVYKDAS